MKFYMKSLLLLTSALTVQNVEAQDWANLGRFADANAELLEQPRDANRVVFMGNSITEEWTGEGFFRTQLSDLSYFDNPSYVNRGIGVQTTAQMLHRFPDDVIALQPAAVVILAGINDIAGNPYAAPTIPLIADNIFSMAELAEADGINVVLSSVLPALEIPWAPGKEPAGKVIELNGLLEAYADERDFVYLDYFSAMVDEQNGLVADYTFDGVHPNLAGYEVMQPLAEAAIRLTFEPPCDPNSMGDLNGNGTVGFPDFLILAENFGNAATDHTMGDIDCNGTVEFPDFLALAENFGKTVGVAQAVPEPTSFALLVVGLLGGLLRRHGRD